MITLTSIGKEKLQSLIKSKVNLCNFLEGIELEDLNLSNGILDGIRLNRRKIKNCNFTNAKIRNAHIIRCRLINCNCTYADFENSYLNYTDFGTACMHYANLVNAKVLKADFSKVTDFCHANITLWTRDWLGARVPNKLISQLIHDIWEVVK